MPEWGCRVPLKGAPSWSKISRNTNGFRISPKSDGLIKRVTGPCVRPRVRWTIARASAMFPSNLFMYSSPLIKACQYLDTPTPILDCFLLSNFQVAYIWPPDHLVGRFEDRLGV